jgi:hypothetical protein
MRAQQVSAIKPAKDKNRKSIFRHGKSCFDLLADRK